MYTKIKIVVIIVIILFSSLIIFSSPNPKNILLPENDTNTNLFIIGLMEIENPILLQYEKKYIKHNSLLKQNKGFVKIRMLFFSKGITNIVTSRINLSHLLENKKHINYLLFENQYFDLIKCPNNFIYEYIYPLCNKTEQKLIRYMYHRFRNDFVISYKRRISIVSKEVEKIDKHIFYRAINTNKFLLVLVNYDWYYTINIPSLIELGDKQKYCYYLYKHDIKERKGLYIKILIPVIEIENENDEKEWWNDE
jgi:hypothetical protein